MGHRKQQDETILHYRPRKPQNCNFPRAAHAERVKGSPGSLMRFYCSEWMDRFWSILTEKDMQQLFKVPLILVKLCLHNITTISGLLANRSLCSRSRQSESSWISRRATTKLWKSRAVLILRARQLVQDCLVAVEKFKHWPLMTTQLKNAISSSFTVDNRFDLVCWLDIYDAQIFRQLQYYVRRNLTLVARVTSL